MNPQDKPNLHDMRVSYELGELIEDTAPASPIDLFHGWLADAIAHKLPEPNASSLATLGLDGSPCVRTVLLKQLDDRGFCFFTNYESRKGQELARHSRAALCFLWTSRQRQVCVRGVVKKLPRAEAEAYFGVRPYGHQIGAWASKQSEVIPDRQWLEGRAEELRKVFPEGQPVPCPEFWGGYVLVPDEVEFWQGRPSRLHDRLRYRLTGGEWQRDRLSP
jgi:pyridoxamine 5'-phosphate oxidase